MCDKTSQLKRKLLRLEDFGIAIDQKYLVKDVQLDLHAGELVALLAPSGSGKSVTGKAIIGYLPQPTVGELTIHGQIYWNDQPLYDNGAYINRGVGQQYSYTPQNAFATLDPLITCRAALQESLDLVHSDQTPADFLAHWGFREVHQLLDAYPHQISGGEQQRLALATILALRPKCLIADEITTALDPTTQTTVLGMLRQYVQQHEAAVLLITHDVILAENTADRIIQWDTKKVETARLETTNVSVDAPVVMAFENITFKYPTASSAIIQDFNLTVRRGERVGIIGPSGVGKSTILKLAASILTPQSGKIISTGKKRMIFQDAQGSLPPTLTTRTLLAEVLKLYKYPYSEEKLVHFLEEINLSAKELNKRPGELSIGQCQRINMVRAILSKPDILLMDEPIASLDDYNKGIIENYISLQQSNHNFAILFVSHEVDRIRSFCHRVIEL